MTHPNGASSSTPGPDELDRMSREELVLAGARAGDIEIAERRERFPEPGTPAERRAVRQVALAFGIAGLAALLCCVAFLAVPWRFKLGDNNSYAWFTPAVGLTMGISLLSLGIAMVLWAKKLMPEEVVIQARHDAKSEEFDTRTTGATLTQGLADTGLARRNVLKTSLAFGGGALGLMAVIIPIGGLIRRPSGLGTTPWAAGVHIIQVDGRRVRPEDMEPGSLATVFPDVPDGLHRSDTPVMLIRLRPGTRITYRKGQADFSWGDFIAFSKICTHLGCPVSLYEQQTNRILCPCHQSQFDIELDGKPIFGPASRPLPQLPITVDKDGYFVANGPFIEPIGPAYWERRNDYNERNVKRNR